MPINPKTGEAFPRPNRDISHRRHTDEYGSVTLRSEVDKLADAIISSGAPEITDYTGHPAVQRDVARELARQILAAEGGNSSVSP